MAKANRELEMLSIHCGIGNVLCMYVNSRNIYDTCTMYSESWYVLMKYLFKILLDDVSVLFGGLFRFFYLTRFYNLRHRK